MGCKGTLSAKRKEKYDQPLTSDAGYSFGFLDVIVAGYTHTHYMVRIQDGLGEDKESTIDQAYLPLGLCGKI